MGNLPLFFKEDCFQEFEFFLSFVLGKISEKKKKLLKNTKYL